MSSWFTGGALNFQGGAAVVGGDGCGCCGDDKEPPEGCGVDHPGARCVPKEGSVSYTSTLSTSGFGIDYGSGSNQNYGSGLTGTVSGISQPCQGSGVYPVTSDVLLQEYDLRPPYTGLFDYYFTQFVPQSFAYSSSAGPDGLRLLVGGGFNTSGPSNSYADFYYRVGVLILADGTVQVAPPVDGGLLPPGQASSCFGSQSLTFFGCRSASHTGEILVWNGELQRTDPGVGSDFETLIRVSGASATAESAGTCGDITVSISGTFLYSLYQEDAGNGEPGGRLSQTTIDHSMTFRGIAPNEFYDPSAPASAPPTGIPDNMIQGSNFGCRGCGDG